MRQITRTGHTTGFRNNDGGEGECKKLSYSRIRYRLDRADQSHELPLRRWRKPVINKGFCALIESLI